VKEWTSDCLYAYWDCLDDSCEVCKQYDGIHWIPEIVTLPDIPIQNCKHPQGCRCVIVVVNKGSRDWELAHFIRKHGGKVTEEEISEWRKEKTDRLRRREKAIKRQHDKTRRARKIEKENPQESIKLYKEGINFFVRMARSSQDPLKWRDIPYYYNRLTMVLEQNKLYDEALKEIEAYESLPIGKTGTKTQREAMKKRKKRILKKLGFPIPSEKSNQQKGVSLENKDVNAKNEKGNTPLHEAILQENHRQNWDYQEVDKIKAKANNSGGCLSVIVFVILLITIFLTISL